MEQNNSSIDKVVDAETKTGKIKRILNTLKNPKTYLYSGILIGASIAAYYSMYEFADHYIIAKGPDGMFVQPAINESVGRISAGVAPFILGGWMLKKEKIIKTKKAFLLYATLCTIPVAAYVGGWSLSYHHPIINPLDLDDPRLVIKQDYFNDLVGKISAGITICVEGGILLKKIS